MERSQDEIMNSNDSARESQGKLHTLLYRLTPGSAVNTTSSLLYSTLRPNNEAHKCPLLLMLTVLQLPI